MKVVATGAQDDTYMAITESHTLTLSRLPANLTFTAEPTRLRAGNDQSAQFSATRDGDGAITWGLAGSPAAMIDGDGLVTATTTAEMITVQVRVAATDTHAGETRMAMLEIADFVDFDGDGLIEIHSLAMLHNMRHDLAGTSYKTAEDADPLTTGCPTSGGCTGYELMNDLDFDTDGDGTWTESGGTYTLDTDDTQATYFDTANGGWEPIGDCGTNDECGESATNDDAPFTATFEGNGFVIRNLAVSRDDRVAIGLFGYTTGTIRNLGLEQALADYTGSSTDERYIGTLVGYMASGTLIASHASGRGDSGTGDDDYVGGLVGRQAGGTIIASHASVMSDGGAGSNGVGGLVGWQSGGAIIASYASGMVHGGVDDDSVGGLVGWQDGGAITASYATGRVDGGAGDSDDVGGLVGLMSGGGTLTASYSFGTKEGGEQAGIDSEPTTNTATRATALTAGTAGTNTNVGDEWNAAASGTLNAWNFGDGNQPPALLYNDYDGTGGANDIDYCALFEAANTPCGTLIPGQRAATTPPFGTGTDDIQLARDDAPHGVTANILLPATLTVDGTSLDLTWSIHHDPEASADNRVTIDTNAGIVQVDDDSRTSTRRVILRATTGMGDDATLVNDYRLHIIAGRGGLQNPGLRFTAPVASLVTATTRRFVATSSSPGAISYSVSDTRLATIDPTSGQLTTRMQGIVMVTATVAESTPWRGATTRHRLNILTPSNLAFTAPPERLQSRSDQSAQFSVEREGDGAITWSIVGAADATIDPLTGRITASSTAEMLTVQARVAETDTHTAETITTTLTIDNFADIDNDGLLEIYDLTMLHNIRHNLAGTSYKDASDAMGFTFGCPDATDDGVANAECSGYELVRDLDFDIDDDGTWDSTTLALDGDDSMAPYFVVSAGADGWIPIGTRDNPFSAILEGNGFVIRNLAIRRDQEYIGLFGYATGTIRNLGLEQALADYTGNSNAERNIGTLVGRLFNGAIIASHASGAADGGVGNDDNVGGLVGQNSGGTLTASHASSTVNGGNGNADKAGGLVGENVGDGTIVASHASGTIDGGDGDRDSVGGLVGENAGTIAASHASSTANGGSGDRDNVGGLVGHQSDGLTITSYATGTANGGNGERKEVGGLIGRQSRGIITASYATATAIGGSQGSDFVGGLLGRRYDGAHLTDGGALIASYAAGRVDDGDGGYNFDTTGLLAGSLSVGGEQPAVASYGLGSNTSREPLESTNGRDRTFDVDATSAATLSAETLTLLNAGEEWNDADSRTLNAWDFGDSHQPAALFYNDYDGTGSDTDIDYCALFAVADIECGALIPGQRSATTPQFGIHMEDIVFAQGDTANGVTADILLPTTLTAGNRDLELTWSVHHDPETSTANKVTLGTMPTRLRVDDDRRTSTRTVTLRATTGMGAHKTIANDYPLRIIAGSGALQNPALRFDRTKDTLEVSTSHDFAATSASSGAITYEITNVDGTPTTHATLSGSTVTASSLGNVLVTAHVAESAPWRGATLRHRLAIRNLANLTLTSTTDTLAVRGTHTFTATTEGNTPIIWSVTDTNGNPTNLAEINPMTGAFTAITANGAGQIRVTASVARDATYSGESVSHTLEITHLTPTLAITPTPPMNNLGAGEMYDFAATTNNVGGVITWSVTGFDDGDTTLATIVSASGLLTAKRVGTVKIVATLAEDSRYSGLTKSYTLTIVRRDANLAITTPITEIARGGAAITLTATTDSPAPVVWGIDDANLATLIDNGDNTATLTPLTTGIVTVFAEISESTTHRADSAFIPITIKRPPNLSLVSPVTTLEVDATHNFTATRLGTGAITWSVTDSDGTSTTRATIVSSSGLLTAHTGGTVRITASVAADSNFVAATLSHTLTITRLDANLTFGAHSTSIPLSGGAVPLTATTESSAPITWSINDDTTATLTDNGDGTATLTPLTLGTVQVTIAVTETATHAATSEPIDITINNLQNPNLRLVSNSDVDTLLIETAHTFEAMTDGTTDITWRVTAPDGTPTTLATIDPDTGVLTTATTVGTVEVVATVAAGGTWSAATLRHRLDIRLPARLMLSTSPVRLLINQSAPFVAAREGTGAITWRLTQHTAAVTLAPTTGASTVVTPGATTETIILEVTVAKTATHASETLTLTREVTDQVDDDNDGLIEIYNLTMLHNMRHNLAGTSYKSAADAMGLTAGCPDTTDDDVANAECIGYELVNDLDFDRDGDNRTWDNTTLALDAGDNAAPYFTVSGGAGGWRPIGTVSNPFTAILEGNGFVIRNLGIRR